MRGQGNSFVRDPIPAQAGIGLRGPHYKALVDSHPRLGFLEVHTENYFGKGGVPHSYLETLRHDYPLSFHGVGLSLGASDPLSLKHLERVKQLTEAYQPDFVSEHLSWESDQGRYMNDLLPLPYTEETVKHLAQRVEQTQDYLQRRIMVENVSSYLQFTHSELTEWEFVTAVAERADCDILLDVNNIYVNAHNHNFDPSMFFDGISSDRIKEIHLAGHTINQYEEGDIIIDTHDHKVCGEVWDLYAEAIRLYGEKPTLIEWDSSLPELPVLLEEADTARQIMIENRRDHVA